MDLNLICTMYGTIRFVKQALFPSKVISLKDPVVCARTKVHIGGNPDQQGGLTYVTYMHSYGVRYGLLLLPNVEK